MGGYRTDLPSGSAGRQKVLKNLAGYTDFFRVLVKDCAPNGSVAQREVRQYQSRPAASSPGVLMIDRQDQLTNCPRQGEPQLPPVKAEEPSVDIPDDIGEPPPPVSYPAPGRDDDRNGADDFWEKVRQQIPSLDGLEEIPIPGPSSIPVPSGKQILVGALLVVVLIAAVAACIQFCAAIAAGLTTLGGGLALGQTGSASVSGLLSALVGLIGLQKLWNLFGDPHVVTLDRLKYDMQSVGEFHLLELPDSGIDVQARFRPAGSNVSVLDRIATEINDQRVEVGASFVNVDGTNLDLPVGQVHDLGDGAFVGHDPRGYLLSWPGGIQEPLMMLASGTNVGFLLPSADVVGRPRGLLGNHDGIPGNDLALRDGTPLPANSPPATIYGPYADSWRVTDDESMFSYAANQTTATFTDRSFPSNVVTIGDFSEDRVTAATEACSQAGVVVGPQFDGCVLDLLATGDEAYARSAALVGDVVVSADAQGFDGAGRLGVDFEGAVPPNFAASRYSTDAATSRMAGPIFDKGGYRFYVRNVGRHEDVSLDMDVLAFGPVAEDGRAQSVAVRVNKTVRGTVLFDGGPPRLSEGMNGTLTTTGSGVNAAGKAFTRYRLHAGLGRLGESIDVELTPAGFEGLFDTALGFDNVQLALNVPAAQRFAVTEPFSAPGAGAGAGSLESPGAADAYDFDVTGADAGKAHVINASACTTALTLAITNRDSGAPLGRWANTCTRITTPALPAGRYTLTATPYASAAAGSYSLQMLVRPEAQRFDYAVGNVVASGSPSAGAGNLEALASKDVYSFRGPGGDLYFDHRSCFSGEAWALTLRNSDTAVASGGCADRPLNRLAAGDYELAFTSSSTAGGTYGFQLFATPVLPQDFAVGLPLTVSDGNPASGAGSLETKQSADRYTFTVAGTAPLYIDIQSCLDTGSLRWTLNNTSTGSDVDSGYCTDRETAALPAGTYRLDVASPDEGRGAYALQAWLVPMAPQTFAIGVPQVIAADRPAVGAGNLETKASTDVYSFTLPSGRSALYLDQIKCSRPDMLTWVLVNDISGNAVTVANGTCEDRQIRQLARGDYRLVVAAIGEHHGAYGFRIVASDTAAPSIAHAPPPTAFYGRNIPIDVTTSCKDRAQCSVQLHYRTTSHTNTAGIVDLAAGSWTTVDLTPTGTTTVDSASAISWEAEVPGAAVSTTGIDYYVTARDGDNHNELPTVPAAPLGLTGEASGLGATVAEVPYLHVTTVSPPLLAHITPAYAHADRDLPLELAASCSTGACTATLHYRTPAGLAAGVVDLRNDPGWPKVTMTQTASTSLGDAGRLLTFKATVPAAAVDTRGLDYYFDVTDTETTSYWPGTVYEGYYAPRDGMRTAYQTVHVLEPPHIVHVPVVTAPYRTPTPITATANCPGTRTCTAQLSYRTTTVSGDVVADSVLAAKDYTTVPMTVTRVAPLAGIDVISVAATIPASVADTRGIDYFFRVDDGSTTTWFPGTGQVQGYVSVDGTRVAFQHIRVLEAPHIVPMPVLAAKALQPYTVTSRLTCATESCSLTLHWRNDLAPGETETGWHDVAMTATGTPTPTPAGSLVTFTATIPADKVTTRGLAYYLEAYDGYVHDYAPGTSYWGAYLPLDGKHIDPMPGSVNGNNLVVGSFLVRVLEPPHLVHAPPAVTEKDKALTLTATSNCSSSTCPATLTWTDRNGLERTVAMTGVKKLDRGSLHAAVPGDVWEYRATIPAEDTGATVRYRISITDGYTSDSSPELSTLVYQRI